MVLWKPTRSFRTNTQKRCPFHHRGLECKSRKSRGNWSNGQIWHWSTERSKAKANSFAKRMNWSYQIPSSNNSRKDSTHGHHQMVNTKIRLIMFFAAKDGEALQSQQKQDWGLTMAQVINFLQNSVFSWRKWGKPLDHTGMTPYDYIVEVTNRFKGLDLIERLKNYGWRFRILYRSQWSRTSPRKRNAKRQNGCLRSPYKYLRKEEKLKAKEKRKSIHTHLNAVFQRIARRDKKAFLHDHCKEMEEKNRMGKTRDLLKKIRDKSKPERKTPIQYANIYGI